MFDKDQNDDDLDILWWVLLLVVVLALAIVGAIWLALYLIMGRP